MRGEQQRLDDARRRPAGHGATLTTCCWSPTSPGCRRIRPGRRGQRGACAWRREYRSAPGASAGPAPAGRAAATRGRRRQRARLQPLTRLPRQPQRPGAGRVADRRLPGLRHAADRVAQRSTQFALLGVLGLSPRMRLLQVLLEGLAIGVPGAAARAWPRLRAGAAFYPLLGGDLGGGFFSGSTPLIVPRRHRRWLLRPRAAWPASAGALYPAWLNRMQPLAQALKTGFAQRPPAAPAAHHGFRAVRPLAGAAPRGDCRCARPAAAFAGLTRLPAAVRPAAGRLCRDCPGAGARHRRAPADAAVFGCTGARMNPCRRRNASRCRTSRRRR
jgi:hypothetical protein